MNRKRIVCVLASLAAVFLTLGTVGAEDDVKGEKPVKQLSAPQTKGSISVEEAILRRRSVRVFTAAPLAETEIAQLLWAAQGVTEKQRGLRAAPSAGATYPLETYLVTGEGVFHYLPARHAIETLIEGDVRGKLAEASLGQSCVRNAAAIIAFAAVPERTTSRYRDRGLMYVHMEAGHAAQNVQLQAVALGLGSVAVGAFEERAAAKVLGLPAGQTLLYMVPVGYPTR